MGLAAKQVPRAGLEFAFATPESAPLMRSGAVPTVTTVTAL